MITTYVYQPDRGIVKREGIEAFDELVRRPDVVFWVDFLTPTDEESYVLTGDFGFHPLAIEDAITEAPAPKVDDYGSYLFVVFQIADYATGGGGLSTRAIDIFLLGNGVVTVRDEPLPPLEAVAKRCLKEERMMSRGADFFFHALLDYMVDHYDRTLERIEDEVDAVEDAVFQDPDDSVIRRVFNLKRDLATLKRIVTPMREMLDRFSRARFQLIGSKARLYFRDVFDHIQRINELADSHRDTLNSVLEVYFSFVQSKTNETIKVLTIISTILLPLTFLTGLYGMNFDWMPELRWRHGYLFFWALIVSLVGGMLWFFRRRKWI
ncbi:MAG TPA: magnesium/cobalt transporter CorA [Acidobacteriota bacterium]|nr:magnesium/cobalt transporter CorA [Acidobacteriota bacterium]